jgi:SAM-dependent methyltransferase
VVKLKKPIPPNRSLEQVRTQYLVEKELAERLKRSNREDRKRIYSTMYDELFAKVPDHPRLMKRSDAKRTRRVNLNKFSIVRKFLHRSAVFAEFAPGDCRFAFEVAKGVRRVYGIDISDQRNPDDPVPRNFELIVFDGYDLNSIESGSIDIVFSDQMLEHLHPEDTRLHFELVLRILKPGGKYIFRTPHPLNGPHDISAHFSDEPEGLHLKEWTYGEISLLVMDVGYSRFHAYWHKRGINVRMPFIYYAPFEWILGLFPKRIAGPVSRWLIPNVCGVAVK